VPEAVGGSDVQQAVTKKTLINEKDPSVGIRFFSDTVSLSTV